MTRIELCWAALILLGLQERPNFAGRWISDPEAAPAQGRPARGAPGTGWGSNITVTQEGTRLTVEYPYYSRYDMQPPLRFVYALDGSESRSSMLIGNGRAEQIARASWEGGTLVITTTYITPHPTGRDVLRTEVVHRIKLDNPATLIVETTRAAALGGRASTTTTVYKKQ